MEGEKMEPTEHVARRGERWGIRAMADSIDLYQAEAEAFLKAAAARICQHEYKAGQDSFVAAILRQELQAAQERHRQEFGKETKRVRSK